MTTAALARSTKRKPSVRLEGELYSHEHWRKKLRCLWPKRGNPARVPKHGASSSIETSTVSPRSTNREVVADTDCCVDHEPYGHSNIFSYLSRWFRPDRIDSARSGFRSSRDYVRVWLAKYSLAELHARGSPRPESIKQLETLCLDPRIQTSARQRFLAQVPSSLGRLVGSRLLSPIAPSQATKRFRQCL